MFPEGTSRTSGCILSEMRKGSAGIWNGLKRNSGKRRREPILEEIEKRITEEYQEWSGSPTELCEFLQTDMKPNALTQKLNVNADRLLQDYGIQYWNKRSHSGRQVGLRLIKRDDA